MQLNLVIGIEPPFTMQFVCFNYSWENEKGPLMRTLLVEISHHRLIFCCNRSLRHINCRRFNLTNLWHKPIIPVARCTRQYCNRFVISKLN